MPQFPQLCPLGSLFFPNIDQHKHKVLGVGHRESPRMSRRCSVCACPLPLETPALILSALVPGCSHQFAESVSAALHPLSCANLSGKQDWAGDSIASTAWWRPRRNQQAPSSGHSGPEGSTRRLSYPRGIKTAQGR